MTMGDLVSLLICELEEGRSSRVQGKCSKTATEKILAPNPLLELQNHGRNEKQALHCFPLSNSPTRELSHFARPPSFSPKDIYCRILPTWKGTFAPAASS